MLKNILASVIILAAPIGGATATDAKSVSSVSSYKVCQVVEKVNGKVYKDVYYMYSVKGASYWLDTASEAENVIKVTDKQLSVWKVNKKKLHHGNKFSGQFTSDGWTLIQIIK